MQAMWKYTAGQKEGYGETEVKFFNHVAAYIESI